MLPLALMSISTLEKHHDVVLEVSVRVLLKKINQKPDTLHVKLYVNIQDVPKGRVETLRVD